jgi:muramoyltetrapeptide carboxypeptidase
MSKETCRIGVVAPASRMSPEVAVRVPTLARSLYPNRTPEIFFHPQCFASHGHFAGDDETRTQAFLDIANDESYDAVWFARGGYGSCRVVEAVMCRLRESSRRKAYVGYSDAGILLAALYRAGFEAVAHGPVAQDILRDGGTQRLGERSPGWSIGRQRRWSRRSAVRRRQQHLT